LLALDLGDGDDGRLVQDDAAALDVDQGVGRAQINRHVGREHAEQSMEHPVGTSLWSALGIAARYNKFKDVVPTVQRIPEGRVMNRIRQAHAPPRGSSRGGPE